MSQTEKIPFKLSDSFNKLLIELSEGFLSTEQFDEIFAQFEVNTNKYFFDNSAEANLIRILNSIFDKKSFLLDSLKYLHHIEIICAISSLSNYLTDIVVRNPEYLYILFDQQKLTTPLDEDRLLNEVRTSVSKFKTLSSKTKMLRNTKRKYLLNIGTADILGFRELLSTTEDLSILARVLSAVLFEVCIDEIQKKYSLELNPNYALCSLGKLGGNELNYSSDIDLILFYKENFEIDSINKDYHELITEALQLFIQEATAVTSESYLYRVDFRLRPDGRNSLLCRTLPDYLRYYETRGEDWERQMLIKLGFVAGNINLFNEFKNYVDPFIYPKSLGSSVTETIQRMKRSIESRLSDERNIKLIPGGIRDIEFSVQALQLMNGGKISELKNGNTLLALQSLLDKSLITQNEFVLFTDAYSIFRKIEHFVQLMNDKQTHSLPASHQMLDKLAHYLKFSSSQSLTETIEKYRKAVRIVYESIVLNEISEESNDFEAINFKNPKQAKSNIKYLSHGLSLIGEKQFDKSTQKLFQSSEHFLIKYLRNSNTPDEVVDNYVKVIRSSKLPSVWYKSFEDELFFNSFLRLCEYSQRAIDYIVSSKRAADLFLSKKVFQKIEVIDNKATIQDSLFTLSVQHACGLIKFPTFSELLFNKIKSEIVSQSEKVEDKNDFFIAALGSFANEELSFGSDIDLIVVVDDLQQFPNAQKTFQDFLSRLREKLQPFEVDFRLRPEGKSSQLVWDLDGYQKYIASRMRIWEFQALSKLRFIYGSQNLFNSLAENLVGKLDQFSKEDIYNEVLKMYRSKLNVSHSNQQKIDLKNSPGTLLTIDTIVSLFLLFESSEYKKYINTNSVKKIETANQSQFIESKAEFIENYKKLKNIQIALQNLLNQNKSILPTDKNKVIKLAAYLGKDNTDLLISEIKSIQKYYSSILNELKNT